jgi:tRNA-dihydrouridine synthase A
MTVSNSSLKNTTVDISVAPMMDWTDRHCRYFMRRLSPGVRLYTEMVTAQAIRHGDRDRLLGFDPSEQPLAVQLGGSDPGLMAEAARYAADEGYAEININVGCPSDRVQSGEFGACLMATPERVAECFRAMQDSTDVPITVKSRIGIDDQDSEAFLYRFVDALLAAGCKTFIVHARTAILDGLSPKENRTVPPLNYPRVFKLKQDYPDLQVILNGGLASVADVQAVLPHVDGVMIGREAYNNPYFLTELEKLLDPGYVPPEREQVVLDMLPYIERQLANGVRLGGILRHMLGLYSGEPGARFWRRHISENAHRHDAGIHVVHDALKARHAAAQMV